MNCTSFFKETYLSCTSYDMKQCSHIEIAEELQSHIISYLSSDNLDAMSLVCRNFNQIIDPTQENANYINEERKLRNRFVFAHLKWTKKKEEIVTTKISISKDKDQLNDLQEKIEELSAKLDRIKEPSSYILFVSKPKEKLKVAAKKLKKMQDLKLHLLCSIDTKSNLISSYSEEVELLNIKRLYTYEKKDSLAEQLIYGLVGGKHAFNKLPLLTTNLEPFLIQLKHVNAPLMRMSKNNRPYALIFSDNLSLQILYKKYEGGKWSSFGEGFFIGVEYLIWNGKTLVENQTIYKNLQKKIEQIKREMPKNPIDLVVFETVNSIEKELVLRLDF